MKVYVTNENNRLLRNLNDGVDLTKWINDQITRGYITSGVSSLASLTDVNLTGLQPDYVLTYDAVSGKWVPRFNAATGGNPAGTTGQIQFNNNGSFGASSNLVWDESLARLGIGTFFLSHSQRTFFLAGVGSAQFIRVQSAGANVQHRGQGNAGNGSSFEFFTQENNTNVTTTSQQTGLFRIKNLSFNPSSGNAQYSLLTLQGTIQQSGTANGSTRGLFISPIITSAASWRSIEWNNNTGWGLYGSGTAANYLAGNLAVGTTSPTAKVTIKGAGTTSGTNAFAVYNNSSSVPTFLVRDDGSVGVGVSNPGFSLDVAGRSRMAQLTVTGNNAILTDNGRVVIGGTTIDNSALLNVQSTNRGFLMPRMTTTEKNAIPAPATGLQVYDTTLNQINVYNGSAWVGVGSSTVKPVATVIATAGTIPAIDLESAGTGIYEIDMTNAGVSATFTAPTNPVNGGVYTFRFTNVTSHAIDFPSTFLDQTGNLFDGGTSYQIDAGDFITGYFNGTNYICGKGSSISGSVATGQVAFGSASNTLSGNDNVRYDAVNNTLFVNTPTGSQGSYRLFVTGNSYLGTRAYSPTFEVPSYGTLLIGNELRLYGSAILFGQSGNFWTTSGNFSIGTTIVNESRLHVRSSGATSGTTGLLVQNSTPIDTFKVFDNGLIRLNKNTAVDTQSSAQIDVESVDTDTNIVLTPKGSGAFIVGPAPDGGTVGGNARGASAIDLQSIRTLASRVASGQESVISGGRENTASGTQSFVGAGTSNNATGEQSVVVGGTGNRASGLATVVSGGTQNTASASYSTVVGGLAGLANIPYQTVLGSNGVFGFVGDNQTSVVRVRATSTSNQVTEMFIAGSTRLVLVLPANTTTRVWNAIVQCVAIINNPGGSTLAAGSCISQNYELTIKRTSTGVSLVGTPNRTTNVHDTHMSTADFLISADTDNNSLKIEFQPPSGTAVDTTIRALATIYLTELGY